MKVNLLICSIEGVFRNFTFFCLMLFCVVDISAQATLNYFEDFEGTNNWTFANGTQANKWHVGSATFTGLGSKSLYISNDNGVTHGYNGNSASIVHAYREITIPSGTTNVTLSFDWKARGELLLGLGLIYFDYLQVWLVPSTYNPTAGSNISASSSRIQISGSFVNQNDFTSFTSTQNLSSFAGQNMRLIFEWTNDGSVANLPPAAIDNISLNVNSCIINPSSTTTGRNKSEKF